MISKYITLSITGQTNEEIRNQKNYAPENLKDIPEYQIDIIISNHIQNVIEKTEEIIGEIINNNNKSKRLEEPELKYN